MTREALQEVLDFLNSIEGAGYGGMATFEIARAHVHDAFQKAWKPEPVKTRRDDWHYDSQGYCDNPGRGY